MHAMFLRPARSALVCVALILTVGTISTESQTAPAAFERGWRSGTPTAITGPLTILYADDFENTRSEIVHFIRDERTGQSLRVRFDRPLLSTPQSGTRVTLDGHADGSELYVVASGVDLGAPVASPATTRATAATSLMVSGERRALVVVANFLDATVSCSPADVDNIMFSNPNGYSVAALYRDNSHGQLSLTGNVAAAPFTIDVRTTDACSPSTWGQLADAAVAASGVDPTLYAHKIYVMPKGSCHASGYATIADSPGRAWVLSCGVQGIYAHELGHNLGMDHAGDPTGEFGDWSDPMALSTQQLRGLNAPHRHQLGWTGGTAVLDVTQNGSYDIAPLAVDPASAGTSQILRVRKPDTGEYYYFSYRIGMGFDNYVSDGYKQLLSVHRYRGDGSSTRTNLLAWLGDGQQFVDQPNGITVTMLGHTIDRATARIEFAAPCPVATPLVSLTPRNQQGAAGGSPTYAVSIANADGSACPASTFRLSATVPGGWEGSVLPASVTIAPNATGSAVLTVRSAANAVPATYSLFVDLNDSSTPLHGTLGSGTYAVVGDTAPPSAPSGLSATAIQKSKQIELSWNAANDNVGVVAYRIIRNGAAVGMAKTTKWADAEWSPGATFIYTVVAYDQAGNASPASNSVTVAVSGGGNEGSGGDGKGSGGGKK
jgi:hypothetical protein